jgi:hypothetical protein
MAQQTIVVLTDDIDGRDIPAGEGETIRFGLDGQDYEIDLNDRNAQSFKDAFGRYISAGRRVRIDAGRRVKMNGHMPGRRPRTRRVNADRIREELAARQAHTPPPAESRYSIETPLQGDIPDARLKPGTYSPQAVRAWADSQTPPIPVPPRGRVPELVVLKFRQAGSPGDEP